MSRSASRQSSDATPAELPGLAAVAQAVLALSLLLGGAGDGYPALTICIELAALLLIWFVAATRGLPGPRAIGWIPFIIVVGASALPLVQMLPLPPALWHELPGRELPHRLLKLVGLWGGWRTLSLNPGSTISTALEMLPAIAMFFFACRAEARQLHRLLLIVLCVGLCSALLGALQRAGGELSPFIIFDTPHRLNSPGLFTNRNHQATFLLVCILLSAGLYSAGNFKRSATTMVRLSLLAAALVFSAGIMATSSRTGLILLAPTVLSAFLIIAPPRRWISAAMALAAGCAILWLAAQLDVVEVTLARFAGEDERLQYWADTARAIGLTWPFGTGLGTFAEVYAANQSPSTVGIQYVNDAHNDYLELALEGGSIACALVLLAMIYAAASAWKLRRMAVEGESVGLAAASLLGIAVILLHSIVDYPLRMLSIMTLFGLLWAIVIAVSKRPAQQRSTVEKS